MIKKIVVIVFLFMMSNICFSQEIKSLRIELTPRECEEKTIIIYDSEKDNSSYPFRIFQDALTGWGRKNGCKKINPLFVPKEMRSEGTYIIYVMTEDNLLPQKFKLLNFKVMQNLQSKEYYETDFLQYLYEYMVKKYIHSLL